MLLTMSYERCIADPQRPRLSRTDIQATELEKSSSTHWYVLGRAIIRYSSLVSKLLQATSVSASSTQAPQVHTQKIP